MASDLIERREWLIRKNGYFYRPNRSGYTSVKAEAGRYTEAEARREASIEPDNMTALHQDEVPTPVNYDTAELDSLRTALATERERAEKAERHIAELEAMTGWQPIETAPRDCDILLAAFAEGNLPRYGVGGFSEVGRQMVGHLLLWNWEHGAQPTHWMPLPTSPKGGPDHG